MQDHSISLLEIKRANVSSTGEFEAYASTWTKTPDTQNDVIQRGAYLPALAAHKAAGTLPAMLWSHDVKTPIGRWLSFEEDSHGLKATGKLTLETRKGAEAHALMRDSAVFLSVGFFIAKGGQKKSGSTRIITKISKLVEVSLVSLPSNSEAKILNVKKLTTPRAFEKLLRDSGGLSAREAKRACAGGWRGYVRDERQTDIDKVLAKIDELKTELIERKL
jgi:hypothetical protein